MSRPKPTIILDGVGDLLYGIYLLKHPDTGIPFYVGKSKSQNRPYAHIQEAKTGSFTHKNYLKISKIKQILEQDKDVEIEWIKTGLSEDEAILEEIATILLYGRISEKTGCLTNMTEGGDGFNGSHSSETKIKISESMKLRPASLRKQAADKIRGDNHTKPRKDKPQSELEKISRSNTLKKGYASGRLQARDMSGSNNPFYGKSHSETAKQAMSEWKTENYSGDGNPFYGMKHTDETKKKISKSSKARGNKEAADALRGKPWPEARRKAHEAKRASKGESM